MKIVDTYRLYPALAPANWNIAKDGTPSIYTMRLSKVSQKGMNKVSNAEEKPWFDENGRFALNGADLEEMRQKIEDEDPVAWAKNGLDQWKTGLALIGIIHTEGTYPDDWPDDWPRW